MSVTLGDLTREQMALMTKAVEAQDRVQLARMKAEADQAVFERAVYDALTAGVPVRVLAPELGLSVARVYQLKTIPNQT